MVKNTMKKDCNNQKFNKKQILSAIVSFFLITILIISTGCNQMSNNSKSDKKVLMIGMDGMDPRAMEMMMQEGKLPNFEKLKKSGHFGAIETTISPQSPISWATIATGSNPGKHNIFDFIRRNRDNYLPELSLTKSKAGISSTQYEPYIRGTPFWNTASAKEIPTTIIRWPITFPAEELNGRLLAGLGVPDIKGLLNSYAYYTTEKPAKGSDGADKVIVVDENKGKISTEISGPRTKKGGKTVDITVPMEIDIDTDAKSADFKIQNNQFTLNEGEWSDWVRVEFKVGILTKVSGIVKFYLESTDEFKMYMTTVEIDPIKPTQAITYPKSYSKELAEEIGIYHTLGLPEDTNALNDAKLSDDAFMQQVYDIDKERMDMFWKEFEEFDNNGGVYAFVFDGSDRIQHMFWDEVVVKDEGLGTLTIHPLIEEYYVKKDKFLGKVLKRIDEDTKLLVFSDHGFSTFERSVSINTWLVDNGYMVLKKESTSEDAGELFRNVDWSETKAYSVGFTSIYINEKGREAKGIVDSADKDELMDEMIKKLKKLEDPEYNKKAITDVYKTNDIYEGDYLSEAPDLIVGFERGFRMNWQNAIGGTTPEIFDDNTKHWKADHLIDAKHVPGSIFTNFELAKKDPSLQDIAPTVLEMLEVDIPADMDGESMI